MERIRQEKMYVPKDTMAINPEPPRRRHVKDSIYLLMLAVVVISQQFENL